MNVVKRRPKLLKLLKLITLIVCVISFILNVLDSFEKFLHNAKIKISSTQTYNDNLPLPAFMVCYDVAYNKTKDEGLYLFSESQYNEATLDPLNLNISVFIPPWTPLDPDKYSVDVLNTVYHGRCASITLLNKVSRSTVYSENHLIIFRH